MKDHVWQWLTGIILGIIGIIVSIVLFFFSSATPPTQGPTIKGDDSIQVIDSPGTTIIKKEIDLEARAREETTLQNTEKIIQLLEGKGYKANPQLVADLKEKIQELEKELKNRATKDKRAEEALVASKAGNYEKARELFETLQEEGKEKESELASIAFNLGNVYFVELDFSKALASDLKTFGEWHPKVATYMNNLGVPGMQRAERRGQSPDKQRRGLIFQNDKRFNLSCQPLIEKDLKYKSILV